MKKLLALIRNSFLREFNSPASVVFYLLLPLIFTAAVGAGLQGMGGKSEPQEARVWLRVVQQDKGPLGDALLQSMANVNIDFMLVESMPDEGNALLIPADFTDRLLAGENASVSAQFVGGSSNGPAMQAVLEASLARLDSAVGVARSSVLAADGEVSGFSEETRAQFAEMVMVLMEAAREPSVVPQVQWGENVEADDSVYSMATNTQQASAGQIVTWVQITLLAAMEVMVDERLRGTWRRLLITPTSRAAMLVGKLVSRYLLGIVQIALLLVGGAVLFGVNWGQHPLAVAAVSLSFALATVCLGMLMATIVRTRGQASSLTVGLSMAMAALGGAWYPIDVTPMVYRQVVQVLPSTWAMRAYTDLLARGANLAGVLPEIGVLLGFATIFSVIAFWRFRRYS